MSHKTTFGQAGRKPDMWKHGLVVVVLVLIPIQIQAQHGWTRKADLLYPPRSACAASVVGGRIYVVGGDSVGPFDLANNEVYDPVTDTWAVDTPMITPRGFLTSEVVNGFIYAIGGGYPSPMTRKNEGFDPVSHQWTTMRDMTGPRLGMKAGVVNGKIYVIGGNFNQDSCFEYDPIFDFWTPKQKRPGGGGALSVTVYNGLVYAFGGSTYSPWAPLSTVNAYNPQTNTWGTALAPMPTPRFGFHTYLVGGKIYAIGGSQLGYDAISTVEVYDPVADTWDTTRPDMPEPLSLFAGAVVNNKIYVIGGTADWVVSHGHVWEYDPSIVGVEQEYALPTEFVLYQNYPNPFNPSTSIRFQIADYGLVTLKVYDVLGREVATLVNEMKQPGTYSPQWNASALAGGTYFYRLQAGSFVDVKKCLLVK